MTGESPGRRVLSISRYPEPACSYEIVDGAPVIGTTNEAFDAEFGTDAAGTAVPDAFERFGLQVSGESSDLQSQLAHDESFRVRAFDMMSGGNTDGTDGSTDGSNADETEEYIVETVPPAEDEGFLLFVASPDGGSAPGELGIDHVASVVSHDLRNPLDVARARLDAGRALDEDEHFDHVEQAHERMERIIQDVLTIARGEEVVEPDDTVDLTDVAETAWETVETNGAKLRIDESLPTATADPDRVRRLFENLFRNAVEHGSTGSRTAPDTAERGQSGTDPSVTVVVGRLDGAADGFYVADDGPGIPKAHRQRVFEPGFSTDDHGTGLGLAIVARIADLHDWSITATSSETGGARLEVTVVE